MVGGFETRADKAYDDNGNRIGGGYSTDEYNRLESDGLFTYEYDAEGNRTKRIEIATGDFTVYKWDHRNQLVRVEFRDDQSQLESAVDYLYDALGRRIGKEFDDDGNGSVDRAEAYVWDGANIVLEFEDADGAGSTEDWELSARNLWGPAVDQLLARELDGELFWPLTDNLGSVRDIAVYDDVSEETTIAEHLIYDAFGNVTFGDPSPFRYSYTAQEFDSETGLYYYNARYYDASIGRFLSEDPIADDYNNLYRYVGNDSPNKNDPTGLEDSKPFDVWIAEHWLKYLQERRAGLSGIPGLSDEAKGLLSLLPDPSSVNPGSLFSTTEQVNGMLVDTVLPVYLNSRNTDNGVIESYYAGMGTGAANEVGITNLSDYFSTHAAVDGHEQTLLERRFKGGVGLWQLFSTVIPAAKATKIKGGPDLIPPGLHRALAKLRGTNHVSKVDYATKNADSAGTKFQPFEFKAMGSTGSGTVFSAGDDVASPRFSYGTGFADDVYSFRMSSLEVDLQLSSRVTAGRLRNADGTFAFSGGSQTGRLYPPTLRAATRSAIEAAAPKNAAGQYLDSAGNMLTHWHYGHIRGFESRRILAAAEELGLSQQQLNNYVNARPQFFRIEDAARNLSHVDELSGKDQLGPVLRDMRVFFGQ